jgi:Polysaccharide biosynthesis
MVDKSRYPQIAERVEVSVDLPTLDYAQIQLQPVELNPIIHEIRSTPSCKLLIFGCGHDSRLWEEINPDGTTAFIEDNQDWITLTRSQLKSSAVIKVDYDTRVIDWPLLIDAGENLMLKLPETITAHQWDVILVDAPAGYDDVKPGRMKSIYTALRLVCAGGIIFVHDCERPLESAYCARYLGAERCIVSVKGRALLNGYRF